MHYCRPVQCFFHKSAVKLPSSNGGQLTQSVATLFKRCLLNPCNVVALWSHHSLVQQTWQWHTSQHTDVLSSSRIAQKTILILVHSALCTRFASFPTLAWLRSRYSWNWDIDLFLVLWYSDIEWRWHLLKKSRCWDVNLTSSRHRWLKCVNSHQALRWHLSVHVLWQSNNWRSGWYWGNWCQTVLLQTSRWYIQLAIRQKALRRRPARTSKTNNYVSCWLHHWTFRNERKMKDKHELITLNEKAWWSSLLGILKYQGNLMRGVYRSEKQKAERAWCQVRLEISKFHGNLMRCFRATVNQVKTRFPKETEEMNRETVSRVVFILFSANVGKSLLDGNNDHLLNQARSENLKQEHQVESLNICINELQQQAYVQRLELEGAHHGYV